MCLEKTYQPEITEQIIELEKKLHQPKIRQDVTWLMELLHDEFEEIGRSGSRYDKQDVIKSLTEQNDQPEIFATNFKLSQLEQSLVLLTYDSFYQEKPGIRTRITLRSSIWKLNHEDGRWQMRFHQGTPAA